MARHTSAIATPGTAAAMPWSIASTTSAYLRASSSEAGPTTTVRQICASWPRTLGVISARMMSPACSLRPVEGCTARLCGPAQSMRKLSSAPSVFICHFSVTASSSSLSPGRAIASRCWYPSSAMRVASRALAISSVVFFRAASKTRASAARACGSAAAMRSAICEGRKGKPAKPTAAAGLRAARVANSAIKSLAPITEAMGQVCRARSASQVGVTMSCIVPSRSSSTAAAPSDLKPLSTMTGLGVSMKCAPSCSPIRRSSFSCRMRRQMSVRRSSKFMEGLELLRAGGIAEVGILEQLVERLRVLDHALLVHVALDGLEILAVGGRQPVFPRIAAKCSLLLFDRGAYPGERHHAGVLHPAVGHLLRLFERLHQVGRHPGIFVDNLLLDGRHMHDREIPGLAKIIELDRLVIGEQARDALVALRERPWDGRRDHRRDVAVGQHIAQRLRAFFHLDPQSGRRVEGDVLAAVDDPGVLPVRHAVMLFQDAAHPDIACRHEIGAA